MSEIQDGMFEDIRNKIIFGRAQEFGCQYLDKIFVRNVFPTEEALDDLKVFEEEMPEMVSGSVEVIELLNKYGAPATVAQMGGRYFGFVCGSAVPVGLAAKTLATFWDQNSSMYVLSPLASKLEAVVENWMRTIFNLPADMVAGFVSGTSTANLCGLAAARYRLLKNQNWDINEDGLLNAPSIRIIAGKQAHSTIVKTIGLLGFGNKSIQFIDTDDQGRIRAELIPELDNTTLLILQAGNVNSGSFDDFSRIVEKARKAGAWVHIDGAFGLWAGATKKLKYLTRGIEHASSWAVDGHKTLNTPYDCGIVMCCDKEAITSALHMGGAYLAISDKRDGMFYTPELSKRARIIELWATMKYLGRDGIDQMVTGMHERAKQFASEIGAIDGFEVLNEVLFNQVVVCCKSEEITTKVVQKVQELRECWAGGSVWRDKKVIRISICSWATTAEDISFSVRSFQKALNSN